MARQLLDSNIKDEIWIGRASERQRRRSVGRLGGLLFCAGALLTAVSGLTLDSGPPSWAFAVTVLAFVAVAVAASIPWERISPLWLHALPVIATLAITAGVRGAGVSGDAYAWLYLVVVIAVAYSFRSRLVIAAYLAFVCACLVVSLIGAATGPEESLRDLLMSAPTLVIAAILVAYFRERLEAGKHTFEALSRLDPLTGVGNYRTFHERLDYEIARHQRHDRRFVVMVLDLGRFKAVNETYGHLEGDRVLREVGKALAHTVRDQDTVARQGGDEFSVLAPETTTTEAIALAQRLRDALARISVGDRPLAASLGWAIYPEHGLTARELLAHADAELLVSKASARARPGWASATRPRRFEPSAEPRGAVARAGSAGVRS